MSAIERALEGATSQRLRETGQLQCFEAQRFVEVAEQEIRRAQEADPPKQHLKIETTLDDAARLVAFMRRAILLGA